MLYILDALSKDGKIGGERAYSTGGQHIYKETEINELLEKRIRKST